MAKYKNKDLKAYYITLKECIDNAINVTGYAIAHNYRSILNAIGDFLEKETEIINKYGEKDKDGVITVKDPEKVEIALAEIDKYGILEVECDIMKIPENSFIDSGLTARQMILLQEFMLEDNKSENDKKDEPKFDFDEEDK